MMNEILPEILKYQLRYEAKIMTTLFFSVVFGDLFTIYFTDRDEPVFTNNSQNENDLCLLTFMDVDRNEEFLDYQLP